MATIRGALFFLWHTSLTNSAKSRLERLRQPKYLLGAVVGIAYIYWAFFGRRQPRRSPGASFATDFSTDQISAIATFGALVFLVLCGLRWLWARERASLNFTEAEIAHLFPAPIHRSTLIHYRLIRSQAGVIFTAIMLALFTRVMPFFPDEAVTRFIGWSIILATSSLHSIASAFVITRWLDRGITQPRRQVMMGLIFAAILAIAITVSKWTAPSTDDLAGIPTFVAYIANQFATGPLAWILLPAKWVVQPLFAADSRGLLLALGPALLVYAAHYLWVLNVEVSFAEGSIAKAAKRAAKLAAYRQGKFGVAATKVRRPPFNLAAARRPEIAFLWKNLLSSAEYLRLRTAVIAAVIIVVSCTWLQNNPSIGHDAIREGIGLFALVVAAYLMVLGPQMARLDFRGDIRNVDILKTYPLRGWQIALGEILTPTAILTVLLWLTLLAAALAYEPSQRTAWLTPQLRFSIAIGLALTMPLICALQLLVVNAATLVFPAWSQAAGRTGPPSIENMGQGIFFLAGQLLVIAAALIPAALVGGAVYSFTQWTVGETMATLLAAGSALAILVAELSLGLRLLGAHFERFDLSAELRN